MALTTVKSDQIQTSVALAGSPTTTTQSASDNSTKVATTAYADTAVANLVASAPAALNTLDELAAALNDDASFSTTITNSIATKLPLAGGTLTGALTGKAVTLAPDTAGKLTIRLTTNAANDGRILLRSDTTDKVDIQANGTSYFNGGNVGIGTATPGTLLHLYNSSNAQITLQNSTTGTSVGSDGYDITLQGSDIYHILRDSGNQRFYTAGTERMRIESSGNTTFIGSVLIPFGSASAPSLAFSGDTNTGIYRTSSDQIGFAASGANQATFLTNRYMFGTTVSGVYYDASSAYVPTMLVKSSHSGELATLALINGDNTYGSAIDFAHITSNTGTQQRFASIVGVSDSLVSTNGSGHLSFRTRATGSTTNVTERMRIDSSGNIGIGTTSPATGTHTSYQSVVIGETTSSTSGLSFKASTTGNSAIFFSDGASPFNRGQVLYNHNGDYLALSAAGSEALRIDSSGNVLIGKQVTSQSTAGTVLYGSGQIYATANNTQPMILTRTASHGAMLIFYTGATETGRISSRSNGANMRISTDESGIDFGGDGYLPMRDASITDNSVDLGSASYRYKNLYLSGGVLVGGTGTANNLNDYEEGNWTPTISGNSGATGQSYAIQNGKFTKIGSFVHYTFDVQLSAVGSMSGSYVVIGGLPFTGVGANIGGTANIGYHTLGGNAQPLGAYISGANVYLMEFGSSGTDYVLVSEGRIGNSQRIIGSLFVHTTL